MVTNAKRWNANPAHPAPYWAPQGAPEGWKPWDQKARNLDHEREVFLEVAQDLDGFREYQAHKDGWEF